MTDERQAVSASRVQIDSSTVGAYLDLLLVSFDAVSSFFLVIRDWRYRCESWDGKEATCDGHLQHATVAGSARAFELCVVGVGASIQKRPTLSRQNNYSAFLRLNQIPLRLLSF